MKIEFVTAERKKGNNKQKRFVTFNWNIHTIFHKFCQNILPPFLFAICGMTKQAKILPTTFILCVCIQSTFLNSFLPKNSLHFFSFDVSTYCACFAKNSSWLQFNIFPSFSPSSVWTFVWWFHVIINNLDLSVNLSLVYRCLPHLIVDLSLVFQSTRHHIVGSSNFSSSSSYRRA